MPTSSRRHAAIMFTDIVGYTALMGSDEDRAFEVLKKNREIHSRFIEQFNGTLIKEMGDGMLISFNLASDAVRCAIEIQKACKEQIVPLKIGIHEGEMVFEGADVLGDGVNIASRLQEDAPEGCISISGSVYRDIKNKSTIKAEFFKEKRFKNVDEPIKVYKVYCEEEIKEEQKPKEEDTQKTEKKYLYYILTGAAVVIAAIFIWYNLTQQPAVELEKSVAVIPFVNLSNDPEQEYFSDGMVDEILDHLFKVGDLKVISRTSSMRFKNTELPLKEIAAELGVSAILEGSVRKVGNEVRITVQLIDAKTDTHLWSETYEGDLSDVFSIQSEVAQNVARELKTTLTSEETELIQNKPSTTNSMAYDFYLKGNDYWSRYEAALALEMYTKAISEDSLFAPAYGRRASMHLHFCWLKIEGWFGHDILAKKDIAKGFQLDPESIEVKYSEAIYYYMIDRDYERSLKILNELKQYAPNMAELYAYSAYNLRRQGKWEESINELKQGILLDPFNANYINNLSSTYRFLHQYDSMIENCKQGLALVPDFKLFNKRIFWAFLDKTGDLKVALKESEINEEDVQYEIYYFTRQYDKLIELIQKEFTLVTNQSTYRPKTYELAFIYYLSGNTSLSKIYSDSAITCLKDKIREIPEDDRLYATLGKCYAFSGNIKEAHSNGKKSVDLLPVALDAYQGQGRERNLLEIYIITGNYDLALDKIEYLLSIPSSLSLGDLLINPKYDKLRGLPRFQEIFNSTHCLNSAKSGLILGKG